MWGPTPTLGLKTLCTSVFGVEEGLRSSLYIVVIIVKIFHWVKSESHPVGHFALQVDCGFKRRMMKSLPTQVK
jgi:hypothetical protein